MMNLGIGLLAILMTLPIPRPTHAQEKPPVRKAVPKDVTEDDVEPGQRPPVYRKSKLTQDRTEMKADRRKLTLTLGEDKLIDLDMHAETTVQGQPGFIVGNPKTVAITIINMGDPAAGDLQTQVLIKPLAEGTTTVGIRDPDDGNVKIIFEVRVTASNLSRTAEEIKEILHDIEGVTVKIVGKRIVIDGEVIVPQDYGRVFSVAVDGAFKDNVINLVTLSPITLSTMTAKIQEEVSKFSQDIKVRVVNRSIWLEGQAKDKDEMLRALLVANIFIPDVIPAPLIEKDATAVRPKGDGKDKDENKLNGLGLVHNFITIPSQQAEGEKPENQPKLLRITVHFVELTKDYGRVFGFKWAPGFQSDPTLKFGEDSTGEQVASGTSFTATISSLFPRLQSAQKAGFARILKSGTILVKNNESGSISENNGFPVIGGNNKMSAYKSGFAVSVKPQIRKNSEIIDMDINTTLESAVIKVDGGNQSHVMNTKLFVKSNESAAIGGITSQNTATQFNKDDPLETGSKSADGKDIPLFNLLRSKAYSNNRMQYVVFVTPQVVESASDSTEDLKKNFRLRIK